MSEDYRLLRQKEKNRPEETAGDMVTRGRRISKEHCANGADWLDCVSWERGLTGGRAVVTKRPKKSSVGEVGSNVKRFHPNWGKKNFKMLLCDRVKLEGLGESKKEKYAKNTKVGKAGGKPRGFPNTGARYREYRHELSEAQRGGMEGGEREGTGILKKKNWVDFSSVIQQ